MYRLSEVTVTTVRTLSFDDGTVNIDARAWNQSSRTADY